MRSRARRRYRLAMDTGITATGNEAARANAASTDPTCAYGQPVDGNNQEGKQDSAGDGRHRAEVANSGWPTWEQVPVAAIATGVCSILSHSTARANQLVRRSLARPNLGLPTNL